MDYVNSVNLRANTGFPYLVMDIYRGKSVPEPPGFNVFHWHEDFQFILCYEGETYVHTLDHTYFLKAGNGIFLNKNVVHFVAGSADYHYKSFLFPEQLVSFYPGSQASKMVHRLAECGALPALELKQDNEWQKEILDQLADLAKVEEKKTDTYTYEILVRLSEIWLVMIKNIALPDTGRKDMANERMAAMLRFIETHFSEDITMGDIASSADISKSEATRCFKRAFQETPYNYLIEYRLSKAATLLTTTDLPVGEIAGLTGFNSSSHFGKLFRESTGRSPREYRKEGALSL